MPRVQQGFHRFLAPTPLHLAVVEPSLKIDRRVLIGVDAETARLTAKRLLGWAIGTGDKITSRTSLRRTRRLACPRPLPTFPCAPGELLGQMAEIAGVEIGVGPPRLEAHRTHAQVFIADLIPRIVGK